MSEIPQDLSYTKEHEWTRREPDGRVMVGITDFAQEQLGDIVYLSLPEVGTQVEGGEPMGEVESTKSVSDIYAPVNGKIAEVNTECRDNPESVNSDPYGEGWLVVIEPSDPAELTGLLSSADYAAFLAQEAGEEADV